MNYRSTILKCITIYTSLKVEGGPITTIRLSRGLTLKVSTSPNNVQRKTKCVGSHLLTTPHDLHRRRRKPLEPFFSRLGITRLWPILAEVVEKFAGRLEALKGTESVVRLDHACLAFSGDVIGQICWDDKEKFLDDPNFAPEWHGPQSR